MDKLWYYVIAAIVVSIIVAVGIWIYLKYFRRVYKKGYITEYYQWVDVTETSDLGAPLVEAKTEVKEINHNEANSSKFTLRHNGYILIPSGTHSFQIRHNGNVSLKIGDIFMTYKTPSTGEIVTTEFIAIEGDGKTYVPFNLKYSSSNTSLKLMFIMDGVVAPASLFYN